MTRQLPVFFFAVVLAASAGHAVAQATTPPATTPPQARAAACNAFAAARIPEWQAQGLSKAEIARRQKLAAASCMAADTDSATSVYVGMVNVELKNLANMFMDGALTGAEHLSRMRDRGRKLRRARANAAWASDWLRSGDADGDLVPDNVDKCLATPALAPTYDNGCTRPPAPPSPQSDDDLVRALAGDLGVIGTRQCNGAVVPDTPTALSIRRSRVLANPWAEITVAAAANQPPGCLVVYELMVDTYWMTGNAIGPHRYEHAILKDFEGVAPKPGELTFTIFFSDGGRRGMMAANIQAGLANRWRVRAINGTGLASPWSEWLDSH